MEMNKTKTMGFIGLFLILGFFMVFLQDINSNNEILSIEQSYIYEHDSSNDFNDNISIITSENKLNTSNLITSGILESSEIESIRVIEDLTYNDTMNVQTNRHFQSIDITESINITAVSVQVYASGGLGNADVKLYLLNSSYNITSGQYEPYFETTYPSDDTYAIGTFTAIRNERNWYNVSVINAYLDITKTENNQYWIGMYKTSGSTTPSWDYVNDTESEDNSNAMVWIAGSWTNETLDYEMVLNITISGDTEIITGFYNETDIAKFNSDYGYTFTFDNTTLRYNSTYLIGSNDYIRANGYIYEVENTVNFTIDMCFTSKNCDTVECIISNDNMNNETFDADNLNLEYYIGFTIWNNSITVIPTSNEYSIDNTDGTYKMKCIVNETYCNLRIYHYNNSIIANEIFALNQTMDKTYLHPIFNAYNLNESIIEYYCLNEVKFSENSVLTPLYEAFDELNCNNVWNSTQIIDVSNYRIDSAIITIDNTSMSFIDNSFLYVNDELIPNIHLLSEIDIEDYLTSNNNTLLIVSQNEQSTNTTIGYTITITYRIALSSSEFGLTLTPIIAIVFPVFAIVLAFVYKKNNN